MQGFALRHLCSGLVERQRLPTAGGLKKKHIDRGCLRILLRCINSGTRVGYRFHFKHEEGACEARKKVKVLSVAPRFTEERCLWEGSQASPV